MKNKTLKPLAITFFVALSLLIISCSTKSKVNRMPALKQKLNEILADKNAVVGISIVGKDVGDTLSVNGKMHCPTQSAFKMHVGLAALKKVDNGIFQLDQKIKITKDQYPQGDWWAPLRDDFPEGGDFTIKQLIQYAVSHSDNTACDTLIGLVGSPELVDSYFKSLGISDLKITYNEKVMQSKYENMFENWITPLAATQTLQLFYTNKNHELSNSSYDFFWQTMKETSTGVKRLKGLLPENTVVAHKTGSSGTNEFGIAAATNDWGIVFLPNGQHFFISVMVTQSSESEETNERLIAEICKAAYDSFMLGE